MIYRKTYTLVREQIRQLQEDIKQNSKDIKRASDFGDLKENAEYHAAKETQVLLHNKLQRFEQYLNNEIVEPSKNNTEQVAFGTRVTYTDGSETLTVAVAGAAEYELELFDYICTTTSPLGKQILGKRKGDTLLVNMPVGEKKLTILDIRPLE